MNAGCQRLSQEMEWCSAFWTEQHLGAGSLKARKRWLAGLAAGLLFFSQVANAAQACMVATAGYPASSVPDRPWQAVMIAGPTRHVVGIPLAVACPPQSFPAARPPGGLPLRTLYCSVRAASQDVSQRR